jgi:Predicted permeases
MDAQARLGGIIQSFVSTFAGLAVETLPFLLYGVLLSALIQAFVPQQSFRKLFPANRFLSIAVALVAGLFLPICECASVPLARRLRQSGLPLSTAVAFLLAAPIVNPLTIASTYVAFRGTVYGSALFLRLVIGLFAAACVAIAVELGQRRGLIKEPAFGIELTAFVGAKALVAATMAKASPSPSLRRGLADRVIDALDHASYDFLDMARYLIAGIALAAFARALLPGGLALSAGRNGPLSIGAGIGSAYLLSLCSSADAFVARSAFAAAPYATILAFLAMGPMLDLKNTILISRFFGPWRAAALAEATAVAVGLAVGVLALAGAI